MKDAILKLLKYNKEYLSGEEISNILGVSRTAIWKHIRTLKNEGYVIESQTKLGYLLLKVPDRLYSEEIKEYLKTAKIGSTVHYNDTVESTNITAKDIAEKGFEEGTVVVAEMQTGGKGRLGRGWHSPYGTGIWMSVIVKPAIIPMDAPKITLLTAVSVAQAIQQEVGINPGIKWPNDILVQGKKVCGILTEIKADMDRIHYIIVGIGINVNNNEFSLDIRNTATSLKMETDSDINRAKMAAAVLNNWEENYFQFLQGGFSKIKTSWKELSVNLGEEVTVTTLKDIIQGRAIDIDEDGMLLVEDSRGTIHKIVAGDVSLRGEERESVKIKDMAIIAMFTALTAVLSQISVPLPFSPVPITLQTFAVYLTGIVLGSRRGTIALIVYTLIGLFGLPVFSQGKSGLPTLVGPTGGYIFGFILAAYIIGKIIEGSDSISFFRSFGAFIFGVLVIYALGVGQLKIVLGLNFAEAFAMGALPYLFLELVKIIIGAYLGCTVRKAMLNAFPEL